VAGKRFFNNLVLPNKVKENLPPQKILDFYLSLDL